MQLNITDVLGRVVQSIPLQVEIELKNKVQLFVSQLPAVQYSIQIGGNAKAEMFVVVEK